MEAELLEVNDDIVFLRRADGKKMKIPAMKLSVKDRDYLREIAKPPDDRAPSLNAGQEVQR